MGTKTQNTPTSLSNLCFHPDLLGFLFSSVEKASSDPFKSSSKHRFFQISKCFNHQVSRNFLFTRLRAKEACCHEEEPLHVFKKRLTSLFEVNLPEATSLHAWMAEKTLVSSGNSFMLREICGDLVRHGVVLCVKFGLIRKHECSKLVNKRNQHTDIKWPSGLP